MRAAFVLTLCLCLNFFLRSQNSYHEVREISSAERWVRLNDIGSVKAGQHLLLYQATGATLATTGGSIGSVEVNQGAGLFGLLKVTRVSGDTVFSDYPISPGFQPALTQAIISAGRDTLETNATHTANNYDGRLGGVLFLSANERLIIRDSLIASGAGFRGGQGQEADSDCNRLNSFSGELYSGTDWRSSRRGEGIAGVLLSFPNGRAPAANGGGGGNDHNAGGGGGANVSRGGTGGINVVEGLLNFSCRGNFPGRGGLGLNADKDRIYLGGGGGAGHANNTITAGGGNGGGLIVLWAPVIEFRPGGAIVSDGQPGASVDGDGAGGGGGGGSLLMLADSIFGAATMSLTGGRGGDVTNMSDRCFGPGGGGSGGRVLLAVRSGGNQLDAEFHLDAGGPGLRLNSDVCAPTDAPAGTGDPGSLQPIIIPVPFPGIQLSADTLCSDQRLTVLNTSAGVNTVTWEILGADSTLIIEPLGPNLRVSFTDRAEGTYRVVQTLFVGETEFPGDTAVFTVVAAPGLERAEVLRNGATISVNLEEATGYSSVTYDFGDGFALDTTATFGSHTYAAGGGYPVRVSLINEVCGSLTVLDTTIIIPEFAEAITDIKESYGCTPYTLTVADLSLGTYRGVLWSFPGGNPDTSSLATPTVTYADSGNYVITLRLLGAVGPDSLATITVRVDPTPTADFSFAVDTATVSFTNLSEGATVYLWNFGNRTVSQEENPTVTYDSTGTYTVFMTATYRGCSSRVERTVTVSLLSDVTELSQSGVRVFPNPTTGVVNLVGPGVPLAVRDMSGRQMAVPMTNDQVDLSTLPPGIYLVSLRVAQQHYTIRVAVSR
ncbi:PKD domain-containing protein [Lewinella sp. W8]|uniref:PKD domain-containing protein n=1 Tax=Lewinella sp. W8 TaxID=2528208 RepID=UPI0010677065|nr:PKD domain-containing protein [Lewinella sp. W8]MTB50990.1 PKD domain-containing protein [Lewinella sp. W8]